MEAYGNQAAAANIILQQAWRITKWKPCDHRVYNWHGQNKGQSIFSNYLSRFDCV